MESGGHGCRAVAVWAGSTDRISDFYSHCAVCFHSVVLAGRLRTEPGGRVVRMEGSQAWQALPVGVRMGHRWGGTE